MAGGWACLAAAAFPEPGAGEVAVLQWCRPGGARVVVAVPFGTGVHGVLFSVDAVQFHTFLGGLGRRADFAAAHCGLGLGLGHGGGETGEA